MDGTGACYVKWNKPGSERQKLHFLSNVENRSKYKHYHIWIYMNKMFPKVGMLEDVRKEEKKKRMIESE
jgi:hypothetical protein